MDSLEQTKKDYKRIKLTKGRYAIVDENMYDFLNQWNWHMGTDYAARNQLKGEYESYNKRKRIFMHSIILKTPKGMFADHINQNKLDNRRSNLRSVTRNQNGFNRLAQSNSKSGHKGIFWSKSTKKWQAQIRINGKAIHLGLFENIKGAILARKWGERLYLKST